MTDEYEDDIETPGPGHNKGPVVGNFAADRLKQQIERIESLEEEKKGIANDISAVYAESKAIGFDPKIMRQIIKLRKLNADELREQTALLETYAHAMGMDPEVVSLL